MESINTTNVYVVWRNHILLIQRSAEDDNLPSYWEAPAGHVDLHCPPIDSMLSRKEALRELREETGIYVHPNQLLFLPQFSNTKHLSYLLTLETKLPPKLKLSFEHDDFRWMNIFNAHIPKKIRPEVVNFIRSYINA
jgi:8-oxo-dGTP pyrophosphatase MutT (NUDIX family)